jgi:hypothetical protein
LAPCEFLKKFAQLDKKSAVSSKASTG